MTLWIGNEPVQGQGEGFSSIDPVSGKILWQGNAASPKQVNMAIAAAKDALADWKYVSFAEREAVVLRFAEQLKQEADNLAVLIAKETGKPLWESKTEVAAMLGKIPISIRAYHERTGSKTKAIAGGELRLRHHPLGVMAVLGPYNFPAHLPNGHIVPALLAGNTLVLKPSELTPMVAEMMLQLWIRAGLPKGVINLVQGARETGEALLKHDDIAAVLFTGSAKTGQLIHKQFGGKPEKMLALEMGGNNPLLVSEDYGDLDAAVYTIVQSAFISAGQRCTCARRLFIPNSQSGDALLEKLITVTKSLKQGGQFDEPAPFIGSLISEAAAVNMMQAQTNLIRLGGKALILGERQGEAFVTPAIIDMTDAEALPDEEYFAPLLQVIRYQDFSHAVEMANHTKFGLSAGLLSQDDDQWQYFLERSEAGIVNRNKPLTGASSELPFGGLGASGNLRPSAYYAADYCAYPIASMEGETTELPETLLTGIKLN